MTSPILSPYYLRRPRLWQRGLAMIDTRSFVSLVHRYALMRIPKSANSTVLSTLLRHFPEPGLSVERLERSKVDGRHLSDLRGSDLSALSGFHAFTFVRNPYHRALSGFLDKFRDTATHRRLYGARVAALDAGQISFRGFCRYLAAGGEAENAHWMRQTRLSDALPRLDFVGRVESLDRDLAHVIQQIGGQNVERSVSAGPSPTSASDRASEFFDEECRALIERTYAADFQRFGYQPGEL